MSPRLIPLAVDFCTKMVDDGESSGSKKVISEKLYKLTFIQMHILVNILLYFTDVLGCHEVYPENPVYS